MSGIGRVGRASLRVSSHRNRQSWLLQLLWPQQLPHVGTQSGTVSLRGRAGGVCKVHRARRLTHR